MTFKVKSGNLFGLLDQNNDEEWAEVSRKKGKQVVVSDKKPLNPKAVEYKEPVAVVAESTPKKGGNYSNNRFNKSACKEDNNSHSFKPRYGGKKNDDWKSKAYPHGDGAILYDEDGEIVEFDEDKKSEEIKRPTKEQEIAHLKNLQIFPQYDTILKSVQENTITDIFSGTGSGKTTFPQWFVLNDTSKKRMFVSMPTVISARWQYKRACKMLPYFAKSIGFAAGGKRTANFENAKVVYGTTQTFVNIVKGYFRKNKGKLDIASAKVYLENIIMMCDEAHHPTSENFVLMALCNWILGKGIKMNTLVASATPSQHEFKNLSGAKPFELKGTQFPVTIHWETDGKAIKSVQNPVNKSDFNRAELLKRAKNKVDSLKGDTLVFVPGEGDVLDMCEKLEESNSEAVVLPCYAQLSKAEIDSCDAPTPGKRKIIVATPVAESSITIDGVMNVVDVMLHKQARREGCIDILEEQLISQANAKQRMGRAGRTQKGDYYPIMTKDQFDLLPKYIVNEFSLMPKHLPVLSLLSSGLPAGEILGILDDEYKTVVTELLKMKLIDTKGSVTAIGKKVTKFPLSISTSVALCNALADNPLDKQDIDKRTPKFDRLVLFVISMVLIDAKRSASIVFFVPKDERKKKRGYIEDHCDQFEAKTDIAMLLKIFLSLMKDDLDPETGRCKDYREWCNKNSINVKFVETILRLYDQVFMNALGDIDIDADDYKNMYLLITDFAYKKEEEEFSKMLEKYLLMGYTSHIYNYSFMKGYWSPTEPDRLIKETVRDFRGRTRIVEKMSKVYYTTDGLALTTMGTPATILALNPSQFSTSRGMMNVLSLVLPLNSTEAKEDSKLDDMEKTVLMLCGLNAYAETMHEDSDDDHRSVQNPKIIMQLISVCDEYDSEDY